MDPGRLWDASGRPLDGRSCPGSVRPLAGLDALRPRHRDGEVHAMSKSGSYRGNRGYKSDQQKRHCLTWGDSRHMADDCRF